jgi:hypothetical protein
MSQQEHEEPERLPPSVNQRLTAVLKKVHEAAYKKAIQRRLRVARELGLNLRPHDPLPTTWDLVSLARQKKDQAARSLGTPHEDQGEQSPWIALFLSAGRRRKEFQATLF